MKKTNLIWAIIVILLLGYIVYQNIAINYWIDYYENTELLLDHIWAEYPFMGDTIGEEDIYQEYIDYREMAKSMLN